MPGNTSNDFYGQLSKFDELSNQLFFNIFIHKPDDVVYEFVKRYFPAFTENYEPGGWSMYSSEPRPVYQETMHSFRFRTHPYFKSKFREGRLDIISKENKELPPGVSDFILWFFYDSKVDAETSLRDLISLFERVGQQTGSRDEDGRRIVYFSGPGTLTDMNSVEMILTGDELYKDKYKMFFRMGAGITYDDYYLLTGN